MQKDISQDIIVIMLLASTQYAVPSHEDQLPELLDVILVHNERTNAIGCEQHWMNGSSTQGLDVCHI